MKNLLTSLFIFSFIVSTNLLAGGVYQNSDDFINQAFNNAPPKAEALWLNKDLKSQMAEILNHNYKGLRVRYWQQTSSTDHKSVWILDEIGKEKPITTGIVVKNGKIELVKILVFRESRGWEVRHAFFTDQFKNAELKNNQQLNTDIDNISGATLSVRAVKKLATIALLLDQHIKVETQTKAKKLVKPNKANTR
jgi:hypothetical protein